MLDLKPDILLLHLGEPVLCLFRGCGCSYPCIDPLFRLTGIVDPECFWALRDGKGIVSCTILLKILLDKRPVSFDEFFNNLNTGVILPFF